VLLAVAAVGAALAAPSPTLAQLVGQKLVVRMDGTTPSASLLARARRGEIGGVILFRFNVASSARLRAATASLQRAAAEGGRPKLLIAVDQEGGSVRTIPFAPPAASPRSVRAPRAEGRRTGRALRSLGVNVDLAPVADLPSPSSFIDSRTWPTTRSARAFAAGLRDGGVTPTLKHFPGLAFATRNTDHYVVRVTASRKQLEPGLQPYRRTRVPLVMLSNAVYDAYDRFNAAGWSRRIGNRLLRDELGFEGVTISDSLDGAAHARGIPTDPLAVRAARAGTDLILVTGSEAASRSVYLSLLRAAREGRIRMGDLRGSYGRILKLKSGL